MYSLYMGGISDIPSFSKTPILKGFSDGEKISNKSTDAIEIGGLKSSSEMRGYLRGGMTLFYSTYYNWNGYGYGDECSNFNGFGEGDGWGDGDGRGYGYKSGGGFGHVNGNGFGDGDGCGDLYGYGY